MKIEYAKIDDVNGQITVSVEEKDYADKLKKQLKEIGKTHAEPGFRAGKVPAGIIEKKYGKSVKYDVINRMVGDAIFDYIKEQKLHVLGNPVPVANDDFKIEDTDFDFKFNVGIAPDFDTHVNKDLKVPYYNITITDEMVNTQDENISKRLGKQEKGEEVEDGALVKGVITELDENGQPKAEGIVVENGIVAPMYFKDKEQATLFAGKKLGDHVVFNPYKTAEGNEAELSSMLNIDKEAVKDHQGDFGFDIKEIIVVRPAEHNQDFYDQALGTDKAHNEEEYRNTLKAMMAEGLKNDSNYRFSIDAKKAILDAVGELKLPEKIVKDFLISQNEGLNAENIDEAYKQMLPQLTWELVSEAIADQLAVRVEEEDLKEMARRMAQQQFAQYGMTSVPVEALEKVAGDIMADERFRRQLFSTTLDNKLFAAIREAITAEPKDVTVEEFNALFTKPEEK